MLLRKIALSLLVVLSVSSCKDEGDKTASAAATVPALKITQHDVPLSFEYAARAQGFKETEVRARVGGILLKRNYVEGSVVKEGDVLFQIDPEPYKASLQQAQAKLAQEEAQLKAAITQWKRIEKLFKDRIVSEKSRDDALANMDSLKATSALARAEVTTAQLNLDYTTVTAPISGITSLETQPEGSLIVANSEASLLTTITQVDPIYVMLSISDNDMFKFGQMIDNELMSNPKADKTGKAKVKFADDTYYSQEGVINFINPTIDESTGTVMLRAVFPNPDRKITPGQFVRIELEGMHMNNSVTIPKEAVMQGAQGSFVYKINEKGQVQIAMVETGFTTQNGEWIIEKGLQSGDVVITSGVMKLKEGMPVTPKFADEVVNSPKE